MNNKILIIVLMLIIILGIFALFNQNNNSVMINNTKISIPNNYSLINKTNSGVIISDGQTSIHLDIFSDRNITGEMNKYIESKKNLNQTVKNQIISINNKSVNKTTVYDEKNNTTFINYWFEKDNKLFRYHFNCKNLQQNQENKLNNVISEIITNTK